MSDDYNRSDNEYWDDMYYYENYNKDMDPNAWSGYPRRTFGTGFWIWLIVFIIASNISSSFGGVVLTIGIILWILRKVIK